MDTLSKFSSFSTVPFSSFSSVPTISLGVNSKCSVKFLVIPSLFSNPAVLTHGSSLHRRPTVINARRFHDLERFIDVTDVDECALAALVLRSAFTRTSKGPWQSNYRCDSKYIAQKLKAAEKKAWQYGYYDNKVVKEFPFFPEEFPKSVISEPPSYAVDVNNKLFAKYFNFILPQITSNVCVFQSNFETYELDILVLQCLSSAVYAGINIAEIAFKSNANVILEAIYSNDQDCLFELVSNTNHEKCLMKRLKFLEKKLIKSVRHVKVERLPKQYVLSDFYYRFVIKEQKLLGVVHLMSKFNI